MKAEQGTHTTLRLYTWLLIVALYLPLIVTVAYSFSNTKYIGQWGGFTTRWYHLLLEDPDLAGALKNSIVIAFGSSTASLALALPAALANDRLSQRLGEALVYPPVIIPEITEAVALMLLFLYIGFPLGATSVMIGHIAFNVAYAYVVLRSSGGEGRRLELAARTLGAGRLEAKIKVTLPAMAPSIAAAAAITFLMSFTDFTKTLFTAGPGFKTLTILLWNRARRPGLNPLTSQPYLAAITSVMIGVSLAFLALVLALEKTGDRNKGQEP